MNKTAVMQPYFFPYIGYYQLMDAADTFVILDDVNFIMRGWINRNYILLNNQPYLFSIPLNKASQNRLICETRLNFPQKDREKFLKTFQTAYKKAPYFQAFYPVLEDVLSYGGDDLTDFLHRSFVKTFDYLGISKKILRSSDIQKDSSLRGEDRIIAVCKGTGTDWYVNPCGGKSLYHRDRFSAESMRLFFINTLFENIGYRQFKNDFVPNLSMLDVLMFNSPDEIKALLKQYTLVEGEN